MSRYKRKIKIIALTTFILVISIFMTFAVAGCRNSGDNSNSTPTSPNNNPNDNLVFLKQSDGTYGVKTTNTNIVGALKIPATYNDADVTIVLERAFDNCTKLTSVIIPNTVKIIDEGAFDNCYGLTSVTVYPSIKELRSGAFSYCGEFDFIRIGESRDYDMCWQANNVFYHSTPNIIYQSETN